MSNIPEKNMETVLKEIKELRGLEGLSNGRVLVSLFSDLSSDKKDLRLVRYLVESGCHTDLLGARDLSPAMQQARLQQTINKLCTEMLISEEAARMVCNAFWQAVYGAPATKQESPTKQIQASKVTATPAAPAERAAVTKENPTPVPAKEEPRSQSATGSVSPEGNNSKKSSILIAILLLVLVALPGILFLIAGYGGFYDSDEEVAATEETLEQISLEEAIQRANQSNVLMSDEIPSMVTGESDHPVFGTNLMRSQVASIRFESTLKNAPQENVVDVSANGDGSVLAWIEENGNLFDLYIAAEGGVKAPENCFGLFALYKNAKVIDFNNSFDTSTATDMDSMFLYCQSARRITTEQMDTSNVFYMGRMFDFCISLTALDVSSFDTSNVTGMSFMFNWCASLKELDVSNFDTSNVERASFMFYACTGLESLTLGDFDTSRMETMSSMFSGCRSLTKLDLSGFNTANVVDMHGMFMDCDSLTSLDVSGFNTAKVEDMSYMFYHCTGLRALDLRNFDTSNVADMSSMFSKCENLTNLNLGKNFDVSNVAKYDFFMDEGKKLGGHPWEHYFSS